jgi:putative redox protein
MSVPRCRTYCPCCLEPVGIYYRYFPSEIFQFKTNLNAIKTTAMTDKSKELNASITLVNDKLLFKSKVDENDPISIDYTPPLGDNLGYTSLELLLLSLSSCVGSSVLTFLRKMRKTIKGCEIHSVGVRKEEHPTCFSKISLTFLLASDDTTDEDFNEVLKLSEDTYCPVWAMLKGNVQIDVKCKIVSAMVSAN